MCTIYSHLILSVLVLGDQSLVYVNLLPPAPNSLSSLHLSILCLTVFCTSVFKKQ